MFPGAGSGRPSRSVPSVAGRWDATSKFRLICRIRKNLRTRASDVANSFRTTSYRRWVRSPAATDRGVGN
jgi:hypothetical protein